MSEVEDLWEDENLEIKVQRQARTRDRALGFTW